MSDKRTEIIESIYVAHMGGVDTFFPKLERHLVGYHNKVIIGDGAKWIWRWADDNYPGSIKILDFYHAKDKLVELWKVIDPNKSIPKWVDQKCDMLLNDQIYELIEELKKIRCTNDKAREIKEITINYYEEHEDRMMYKTYRNKGLLIGSGPIEAAHRSVLQCRMKLSGQIWSVNGANAIANLRCLHKSKAWYVIENLVNAAA